MKAEDATCHSKQPTTTAAATTFFLTFQRGRHAVRSFELERLRDDCRLIELLLLTPRPQGFLSLGRFSPE